MTCHHKYEIYIFGLCVSALSEIDSCGDDSFQMGCCARNVVASIFLSDCIKGPFELFTLKILVN